MKKILFLSISLTALFSNFAKAQVLSAQQTVNDIANNERRFSNKNAVDKTAGSKYFNETFLPAKIVGSNEIILVRHNAYTDDMEVSINNEVKIVPAELNTMINMTNSTTSYEYVAYTNEKGVKKEGYLKLISNNPKVKIYKSEVVYLKPEVHPASGYDTYKPAAYTKSKDEYFIRLSESEIKPLSLKKKAIVSIVPEKEKEIASFIKENKISFSEDTDLNQLGRFLNSLM
ncbi:hypothetical protein ABH942_000629 [Flavobacterium sp. 28YEA47A]|uniref:hypothetical protein n=1 Tax=Flavobacterium sp. 28YEA47A TaxID=3156276 RepID=UPI003512C115